MVTYIDFFIHHWWLYLSMMPVLFVIDALQLRFRRKPPVGEDGFVVHMFCIVMWPIAVPIAIVLILFLVFIRWIVKAWNFLSNPHT
jgi:hypothetical protein